MAPAPLSVRILALLAEHRGVWVATPEATAICEGGAPGARCRVWDSLDRLRRAGLVKRTYRRQPGQARVAHWALKETGS